MGVFPRDVGVGTPSPAASTGASSPGVVSAGNRSGASFGPAGEAAVSASSIREQWTVGKGAPQCNDSPTGCFLLVPLWSRSRAETSYKKLLVIFRLKKNWEIKPPLQQEKSGWGWKIKAEINHARYRNRDSRQEIPPRKFSDFGPSPSENLKK